MNIQWLLQCAEPPVSQDFDDDRILAWVVFPLFSCFREPLATHNRSQTWRSSLLFGIGPLRNSCPNKKMRAQLEAMALKVGPDSDAGSQSLRSHWTLIIVKEMRM